MAEVEFEFASLRYLNLWIETDFGIVENVKKNREDKLQAIDKCASSYGVARTFLEKYDTVAGLHRYGPILDVIEKQDAASFAKNTHQEVQEVMEKISQKYGDRNVLSGCTKILWMWFGKQCPITIYDSQVRKALHAEKDEYGVFRDKWESEFQKYQPQIKAVCYVLPTMNKYVANKSKEFSDPAKIAKWASSDWFQRRVFDTYLWNRGSDVE